MGSFLWLSLFHPISANIAIPYDDCHIIEHIEKTWDFLRKTWEKIGKTSDFFQIFSEIFWKTSEFFFTHPFTPSSPLGNHPPTLQGCRLNHTALLTFQYSHARAYARTSAILYFLLSQPSRFSSQSPITVIDTLLFTNFLCRFSESPRRNATENTLKNVRKTTITRYATIRYKDFCEGCESKKHKTPVTRARGRGKTAALKICSHRSL